MMVRTQGLHTKDSVNHATPVLFAGSQLLRAVLVLLAALPLLAGCGGGASDDDRIDAPKLEIAFPFTHARYSGNQISVSGRVSHRDLQNVRISANAGGAEVKGLIAGSVFAIPNVPISGDGRFALTVTATLPNGSRAVRKLTISREPELSDVPAMALDADRARAIMIDTYTAAVIAAPLDGSPRVTITGDGVGSGPLLQHPVAVTIDPAKEVAYVADDELDALFQINLSTGERVIVSGREIGSGPSMYTPKEIDFDTKRDLVLVSDESHALLTIDPSTGDRRVVSDSFSGGPEAYFYRGVGFDAANDRYILSDSVSLFTVDPATGSRTMLSDWLADPSFGRFFRGMSISPLGDSVYIGEEYSDGVLRIDLNSGAREQVTSSGVPSPVNFPIVGGGPSLQYPNDVIWDHVHNRLFVIEGEYADPLIEIEANGDRTIVRDAGIGSGLHLRAPSGIKYDATERRLIVSDYIGDAVVTVDPLTGNRVTVLAPVNGRGSIDEDPMDAAIHPSTGLVYVVDWQTNSLYTINLQTGARTIVADANTGSGIELLRPVQIVIDATSNVAYVACHGGALLAVNLSSGERHLVGDFGSTVSLALDESRGHLYVAEGYEATLHRIDLATGSQAVIASLSSFSSNMHIAYAQSLNAIFAVEDYPARLIEYDVASGLRTVVSGTINSQQALGGGPRLQRPTGIAVDDEKGIAFVTDQAYSGVIAIDLPSGDRQVIAK